MHFNVKLNGESAFEPNTAICLFLRSLLLPT